MTKRRKSKSVRTVTTQEPVVERLMDDSERERFIAMREAWKMEQWNAVSAAAGAALKDYYEGKRQ